MVDRAHDVVDGRVRGKGADEGPVRGADPFCFEGDEDGDLRCVKGLQAEGLGEVGFVPWGEEGEGFFRGRGEL